MDRLKQNAKYQADLENSPDQPDPKPAPLTTSKAPYPDITICELLHNSKSPIYLAFSKAANKQFIMKTYKYEDNSISRKYLNEIRFAGLSHPHVIPLLGSVEKQVSVKKGQTFFVSYILMEVALCDFMELINYVDMSSDEVLVRTYFHQLIEGVEFLHSQGVAHLDLKPENLLLGQDYLLKITDFDLSFKQGDEKIRGKGTSHYRSPELKEKRCGNPLLSDIYTIGVLLFVMRMGYLPYFENEKVEGIDLMDLALRDSDAFWSAHRTFGRRIEVSSEFKELFGMLVVSDPCKRASLSDIKRSSWFSGKTYSVAELATVVSKKVSSRANEGREVRC